MSRAIAFKHKEIFLKSILLITPKIEEGCLQNFVDTKNIHNYATCTNIKQIVCVEVGYILKHKERFLQKFRTITQNRLLQFSLNFAVTFLNGFQTDWQSLKEFLCLRTEIYVQTQGYILKGKSAITPEIDMIGLQNLVWPKNTHNYVICASLKQIACVKVEIWPQTQGKIFARLFLFFESGRFFAGLASRNNSKSAPTIFFKLYSDLL